MFTHCDWWSFTNNRYQNQPCGENKHKGQYKIQFSLCNRSRCLHSKIIRLQHISKTAVSAVNVIHDQGQSWTICFASGYWQWICHITLKFTFFQTTNCGKFLWFYKWHYIFWNKTTICWHKNTYWKVDTFWNMQIISLASFKRMV
jgi:hypothetical protein